MSPGKTGGRVGGPFQPAFVGPGAHQIRAIGALGSFKALLPIGQSGRVSDIDDPREKGLRLVWSIALVSC